MPGADEFILGEFRRTFDERYRLSLPPEFGAALAAEGEECILAKERPGCLSLWNRTTWQSRLDAGVELVKAKMRAGKLDGQLERVQLLGRLLSTRHKVVSLTGRSRLIVPEGFREFLHAEPGGEVLIVGAAVCVEIWNAQSWREYLEERMPRFRRLFNRLSS